MVCYYGGAISFGIAIGAMIVAGFVLFIQKIEWVKLKQYFWRQNNDDRELIMKGLTDIHEEIEMLQKKTNTQYLRRKSNEILDVITFLKKHRLN